MTYTNKARPLGARCLHCHNRPARPNRRWPHLATSWCSDPCRANWQQANQRDDMREQANRIRRMLGLSDDRGPQFTRPELVTIERRLRRLLPYGGLAMRRVQGRRAS